jgi:hypothetical protein
VSGRRIARALGPALGALALACIVPAAARAQDADASAVDFELPLGVGFHLPTYDRVNGLTIPWGPVITVGEGRLVATPIVAYRSNLGKFDPSLSVYGAITPDSSLALTLDAARGSFTNERWIRSDLINSVVALGLGHDSRNWFRADRGEARLVGRVQLPGAGDDEDDDDANTAHLFVGARTERDWSTGWRPTPPPTNVSPGGTLVETPRGPWSFFNRSDERDGMTRPNPAIDQGHITSALLGGTLDLRTEPVGLQLSLLGEGATSGSVGGSFRQITLDGHTDIPTFAGERIEVDGHVVTTSGGVTPRQRYAYLGGSGTLATVDLLSLGGDHLYFVDARYVIPIPGVDLPFVGGAFFAPRFAGGAASVGGYGVPVENIGFRVGLGPLRFDAVWNPSTHGHDFGVGFAFSR